MNSQVTAALRSQVSGSLARGLLPGGSALLGGGLLGRLDKVLQGLVRESQRRRTELRLITRWLNPDAEVRAGRWPDPSPVIAAAVALLRCLEPADRLGRMPEEDDRVTESALTPLRAMLAIPVPEQVALKQQVEVPAEAGADHRERMQRLLLAIVAVMFLIAVAFVMRVLACARITVPRLWDITFLSVVLVARLRSGPRNDDDPHQFSLLKRRCRTTSARTVLATR
ncbi:hypothetical protein [Actinomadura terrae]|uniref:hypothetical protein n=1 Tax=Actinomadura terrae TaxID=604353 RepID=UPI001FA7E148|nr:hypothetical protein [Actinomadura terrae]